MGTHPKRDTLKSLQNKLRNRAEKAIREYHMIESGDRILVGVSGGADSYSLLHVLLNGINHINNDFSLIAVHIDLGFKESNQNCKILRSHFEKCNVQYRIIHTNIADKTFAEDAKKNPCFICSMHRRRHIYETAALEGCNKIAYGHHKDDIIETLLINILYGRKIEAMNPVQNIFKETIQIIRPFTYTDETLIKQYARKSEFPILPKQCPADAFTRRQRIKHVIRELQRKEKNANIRENVFKSLHHVNIDFSKTIDKSVCKGF
jgi:tRNA 2-thiocytidine biosynthesis protein TtcA